MVGEHSHPLDVPSRREELEGADPDVARGHPDQDPTGQDRLARHRRSGGRRSERAGGGYPERRHRLAHHIFAQHRPQRRLPVSSARIGCPPRALQLDVTPLAGLIDDLAEQDRASIAELRHEIAELVSGIGHRNRLGSVREALASQNLDALGAGEPVWIDAKLKRQFAVQADELGRRRRGWSNPRVEPLGQANVGVVEWEGHGRLCRGRRLNRLLTRHRSVARLPSSIRAYLIKAYYPHYIGPQSGQGCSDRCGNRRAALPALSR